MGHNKVYGICENKCKVEVMRADETSSLLGSISGDTMQNKVDIAELKEIVTQNKIATDKKIDDLQHDWNILSSRENMTYSIATSAKSEAEKLKIPVGGIYFSTNDKTGAQIAVVLGYGTWDKFGTWETSISKVKMYGYVRIR